MAASAILAIKILADAKQATSGLDEASAGTSKWSSGLSKAAGVATVALAGVAAVAVSGVKAAAEDAQAQAILATALHKAAGASDAQVKATEDWISKTSLATGVADDQLRPALGNLVRATGDVAESQKAMQLALDISAATGKDVTAVSAALAKGYGGQTTALGRLVPGLDKATLASGDMAAVSAMLADKVGGSAAAAADTAAGQYKIFQVALDETKEGIGAALLPVLTKLAEHMSSISKWAANNTGTLTVLLGVIGGLAAIIVTVNAVTKAYTAIAAVVRAATIAWQVAQFALNVVLAANPIGFVIVAIGLLVAAIVLAYRNSETFRNIVNAAFHAVLSVVQAVVGWIRGNWPLLLAILTGPIGIAVKLIIGHWDDIKSGAAAVLGWFRGSWDALRSILVAPFETAWRIISGIIDRITSAVSTVTNAIKSIPHPKVPDLNPFSASAPSPVASGVVAGTRATFRGVARAPAAGRGTSSGSGVHITVNGALDPEGVARQIRRILNGHNVRVGTAGVL